MSLVEQGLKDGALGIGINAGYAPGYGQKEYFELAKMAANYGVATYTHVRYASNLEPQGAALTSGLRGTHCEHSSNRLAVGRPD